MEINSITQEKNKHTQNRVIKYVYARQWMKININFNILFIKGLKSLRQLFGAKNVIALFLPNFLLFIYIFRK